MTRSAVAYAAAAVLLLAGAAAAPNAHATPTLPCLKAVAADMKAIETLTSIIGDLGQANTDAVNAYKQALAGQNAALLLDAHDLRFGAAELRLRAFMKTARTLQRGNLACVHS